MRDSFGRLRGVMRSSSYSSNSDVALSVRGGDETSSPLWFERESMLLLNPVMLLLFFSFLITTIVA